MNNSIVFFFKHYVVPYAWKITNGHLGSTLQHRKIRNINNYHKLSTFNSALAQYSYLIYQTSTSLGEMGTDVNCDGARHAVPATTMTPPHGDEVT